MIIFAQNSKKDERDEENQPPQIHGGVQGEGSLGSDAGEPDAAGTVQQVPTQPQPDQLKKQLKERSSEVFKTEARECISSKRVSNYGAEHIVHQTLTDGVWCFIRNKSRNKVMSSQMF